MKTYWCKCAYNKNFGDVLGPYLVEKLTSHKVEWCKASESEIVVVGSIGEHLPKQYSGIVAGIGLGKHNTKLDLSKANVLALRGPLTFLYSKTEQNPVLADPGLLASEFVDDVKKEHSVGTILHYGDKFNKPEGYVIDVTQPIETVIKEAAKCEKIITSSLHGLILADSLNIPRKWIRYPRVQGSGFKFYDYSLSLGMHIKPNEWMEAPATLVESKKQQLKEVFKCL